MEEPLQSRVEELGRRIKALCERLAAAGYVFQYPDEVFPGPEAGADRAIARIERKAGAVPSSVKLFWLHVGSVNLCGSHPAWGGCEYPDPLVVYPPSVALDELEDYLEEPEGAFLIPIAPDDFHKADVSGGMFYNVSVPAAGDDPPLNDERHAVSFLAYLEIALESGGFPGLERCGGHAWPVDLLRAPAR
jgi:hypothetical protein